MSSLAEHSTPLGSVANALRTTTTSVNVSNAASPEIGQVLRATSGSAATWQFPFAMRDDWSNAINDFSASGVLTSTTTASSTTAGSTTVYLTDASTFKASQGISIVGAGSGGVDHTTTIASVNTASSYVVLNVATITTVGSGAVVYHDDTVALQAQLNDGAIASGYWPNGDFIITSKLYFPKISQIILGSNWNGNNTERLVGYPTIRSTTIWVRTATSDGIFIGSDSTTFSGVEISQHPSVTRTAGVMLRIGPHSSGDTIYETYASGLVNRATVSNIKILGGWENIRIGRGWNYYVSNILSGEYRRYGIVVEAPIPYGGHRFSDFMFWGEGTGSSTLGDNVDAAIYIPETDINTWHNMATYRVKHGVYIYNQASKYNGAQIFTNLYLDNIIGGCGIKVDGVNNATYCRGNSFMGGWVTQSPGVIDIAIRLGNGSRNNIVAGFPSVLWSLVDTGTNNNTAGNT